MPFSFLEFALACGVVRCPAKMLFAEIVPNHKECVWFSSFFPQDAGFATSQLAYRYDCRVSVFDAIPS